MGPTFQGRSWGRLLLKSIFELTRTRGLLQAMQVALAELVQRNASNPETPRWPPRRACLSHPTRDSRVWRRRPAAVNGSTEGAAPEGCVVVLLPSGSAAQADPARLSGRVLLPRRCRREQGGAASRLPLPAREIPAEPARCRHAILQSPSC